MHTVSTERHIAADPDAIWAVLTDPARLVGPQTGIERLDGDIAPGGRLTLKSELSPRPFKLRVDAFDPPSRMTWTGGMPLGLFRGVRTFELQPSGAGTTFRMREEFSGPLSGMIVKSMPDLQPSFEAFAQALAAAVEVSS